MPKLLKGNNLKKNDHQLTKFEAPSYNSFQDIFITILQRAII